MPEAAVRARELGFEHIDVSEIDVSEIDVSEIGISGVHAYQDAVRDLEGNVVLPVGDVVALKPTPGCSVPAPPEGEGMWERAVSAYRRCPGMRMEPWPGSVCDTFDKVVAMLEEVPDLRLLVDVGHVAAWGGDPLELLLWADHVQLRQATRGDPQRHVDEGGDVDFAAVLRRLHGLEYRGRLSIEYFDLPERGWPLEDPAGHSVALARHIRSLQR
ncbi:MAG: sugar phosphate isomerase/epimerase family protein [Thermoplasmata archaeon]